MATSIGAALLYYATVLDLFTGAAHLLDAPDEDALITHLVQIHSILGVDPPVAVQQLRLVQAHLGQMMT